VVDVVVARDHIGVYFDSRPIVAAARIATLATLGDDAEAARTVELRAI